MGVNPKTGGFPPQMDEIYFMVPNSMNKWMDFGGGFYPPIPTPIFGSTPKSYFISFINPFPPKLPIAEGWWPPAIRWTRNDGVFLAMKKWPMQGSFVGYGWGYPMISGEMGFIGVNIWCIIWYMGRHYMGDDNDWPIALAVSNMFDVHTDPLGDYPI